MRGFATSVMAWQAQHGRHHLPWQHHRTPYTVWLSEVMLQQTQVATVLGFYPRFLLRFPTVASLAAAPLEDVLALWSGMGYYTRARNLHRAAIQVMTQFGGRFPQTAKELEQLVGVGRSTAAAIAAFCYGERVAILDGNVKRVLSRVLAFSGDLAKAAEVAKLWSLAQELLPARDLTTTMPAYTQGLMDMGSLLCHARKPSCTSCPVARLCKANLDKACEAYPVKTKKLKRSSQSLWLLLATNVRGETLLLERPTNAASKIWAGLYSLPPFASEAELLAALPPALHRHLEFDAAFKHVLTHKDLHLHVVRVVVPARAQLAVALGAWYTPEHAQALGLPAPVRKLLTSAS